MFHFSVIKHIINNYSHSYTILTLKKIFWKIDTY
jgi:hypothetical protein